LRHERIAPPCDGALPQLHGGFRQDVPDRAFVNRHCPNLTIGFDLHRGEEDAAFDQVRTHLERTVVGRAHLHRRRRERLEILCVFDSTQQLRLLVGG
jgi:hypothetical protein